MTYGYKVLIIVFNRNFLKSCEYIFFWRNVTISFDAIFIRFLKIIFIWKQVYSGMAEAVKISELNLCPIQKVTLRELIFAGAKFCGFYGFGPKPQN